MTAPLFLNPTPSFLYRPIIIVLITESLYNRCGAKHLGEEEDVCVQIWVKVCLAVGLRQ